MALNFYKILLSCCPPVLRGLLAWRRHKGKEDGLRLHERMGQSSLTRPAGHLIWIHAASVGEAQSALILLNHIENAHVLVTSGTVTSAKLLSQRLPAHAIHQYMPLDAPQWVRAFLDHWKPDAALWMESELWPNMLMEIKRRKIPAALVNARLSDASYRNWKLAPKAVKQMLGAFTVILAQTQDAADKYASLGAPQVHFTDNLKYSAAPLPCDTSDLSALHASIGQRPCWVYASTHDGEEQLAARIHERLKERLPDILTIIVPRHPERRAQIAQTLARSAPVFRGQNKKLPTNDTGLYIADTLGELGLFYSASPIAMIGRSFSFDGGGGHNPIEAAQLDCAVLSGPHVQYQQALFDEMIDAGAATLVADENDLYDAIVNLLMNETVLNTAQENARRFAARKTAVIETVITYLSPLLPEAR